MLKVYDLRTEYLKDPLGVDTQTPRLSWKLTSDMKNVKQKSYRIVAVSNGETLWDSGTINSDDSQRVHYTGPKLNSSQEVSWTVEICASDETSEEVTAISEPTTFEMGLLSPTDWKAKWIEPEDEVDPDADKPAPYLRKTFQIKHGLVKARIYQTAHGLYEFWINGVAGTEDKFKPGLTSYYSRIQYQIYDVMNLLKEGENCWAVALGDGWWRGVTGGTVKNNFGYKLHFFGQLELTYSDGSREIIATDESFKTSTGGLLASDMQMGDIYDAQLEPVGWKLPGFDDSSWENVHLTNEHTDTELIPSRSVPVLEMETFEAKPFKDANGDLVLDFGQNVAGYVRMRLRGCNPGQKIRLTHGEDMLDGSFNIDSISHPSLPLPRFQEVTYICAGEAEEEYCPMFSIFGYRYAKVEGYDGPIEPGDFVSTAVYSAMEETGQFTCSNPLINKLVENSMWSQKGNFMDVPTDCPTRERNAWTGDNQAYVRTATSFMNVYTFYEKWLQDLTLEQYASGKIGFTFPSTSSCHNPAELKRHKEKFPVHELAGPTGIGNFAEDSTGWGDAAVWLPYIIYMCYGDKQILKNQYDSAKRWTDYMLTCAKEHNPLYEDQPQYHTYTDGELDADYIYDTRFHFGEWLEPIPSEKPINLMEMYKSGNPIVATAYMCRSCSNVSEMAETLGYKDDAKKYSELSARIKRAYDKYLIPEDCVIQPGHQAPYVRVLAMDLCSSERRSAVAAQLVEEIEKNDYHLNTGFLSTPFLLHVLVNIGRNDLAFRILEQTGNPGWLYPVIQGSTTIPESWDAIDKHMGSYNHYSYGSVCDFLFSRIGGIQPCLDKPGYKHFVLAPIQGGSLTEARAVYESLYGTIVSEWKKTDQGIEYRFTIPCNTTATVILPDGRTADIGSGNYVF